MCSVFITRSLLIPFSDCKRHTSGILHSFSIRVHNTVSKLKLVWTIAQPINYYLLCSYVEILYKI